MKKSIPFCLLGLLLAIPAIIPGVAQSQSLYRQNSHTTAPLNSIYFSSGELGVAVGSNATSVSTRDEGVNWIPGILDPNFVGNFNCCVLNDDTHQAYAGDSGTIFTILSPQPPLRISLPETKPIYAMTFSTYDTAVVVGGGGLIYKSNDSGKTWAKIKPPALLQNRDFHGVTYFDDSTYWIVGAGGAVLYTEDAGTTWQRINVNTTHDLYSICFPDTSSNGWIVGDHTLLYTTDAGDTWISVPTTADLRCVFGYDGQHACAAGLHGTLLATSDEQTWTSLPTGTTANLYSVDIPDSVYVCGDSGIILSTFEPTVSSVRDRLPLAQRSVKLRSGAASVVLQLPPETAGPTRVTITNRLGMDVYSGVLRETRGIELPALPLGVYFYSAISGDGVVQGKFILW